MTDEPPVGSSAALARALAPELVSAGTTPAGGEIVDGRYEHTGFDFYPNAGETLDPNPYTYSGVFEFVAGKLEAVVARSLGSQEATDRFTASYVATDTELSIRYGCPDAGVLEKPLFTAESTELRLFYRITTDRGEGTAELVLTKR